MITTHTNQYATRRNGNPDPSSSTHSPNNRSENIPKISHAMTKAEAMAMPAKSVPSPPIDSTPSKALSKSSSKKWRKKAEDRRRFAPDGAESFDDAAVGTAEESPLPFEKSNAAEGGQGPQVFGDAAWDNVKTKLIKDSILLESTFRQDDKRLSSPQQSYESSISASSSSSNAFKSRGKNNKKTDRSSPKHENEENSPSNVDAAAPIPHNGTILKLASSTKKNNAILPTPIFTIQTTAAGTPSSIEFKKNSPRKSKRKSGRRSNNSSNNKNGKSNNTTNNHNSNNNSNNNNDNNNNDNHDEEMWKMPNHYVDYSTNAQGAAILASLGHYSYYTMHHNPSMTSSHHDPYSQDETPPEPHPYETVPPHSYYAQGSAAAAAATAYPMYYYPSGVEAYDAHGMMPYVPYEETMMYSSYYYPVSTMEGGMYCCLPPPSYGGYGEDGGMEEHCASVPKVMLNVDAPSFEPKKILQ